MSDVTGVKRAGVKLASRRSKRLRLGVVNVHSMGTRGKTIASRTEAARNAVFQTGETLQNILLNLDVTDLGKCIRVSKDWRTFITTTSPALQRKMFLLPGTADLKAGRPEQWTFDPKHQNLRLHTPGDENTKSPSWRARTVVLEPALLNPLFFTHIPNSSQSLAANTKTDISGLQYAYSTRFLLRPDLPNFRHSYPRHLAFPSTKTPKGEMAYTMFLTQPPTQHVVMYLAYYTTRPAKKGPRPMEVKVRLEVCNPKGVRFADVMVRFLGACGGIESKGAAEGCALRVAVSRVWCMGVVFPEEGEGESVRKGFFDGGDGGEDVGGD